MNETKEEKTTYCIRYSNHLLLKTEKNKITKKIYKSDSRKKSIIIYKKKMKCVFCFLNI